MNELDPKECQNWHFGVGCVFLGRSQRISPWTMDMLEKAPFSSKQTHCGPYLCLVLLNGLGHPTHPHTPAMDSFWPPALIVTTLEEFGGAPTSHGPEQVPVPREGPGEHISTIYIFKVNTVYINH